MGDRWHSSNLMTSSYIWLPLTFSGVTPSLGWYDHWTVEIAAGTWQAGASETKYEAEDATLSGGAKTASCSGCSGGDRVGYLGGSSDGTLTFSGLTTSKTASDTVVIAHCNGDSAQRWATVTCNGVSQTIAFLPTTDGNTPGNSTLNCALTSGSSNTITISSDDGTWAADIDAIKVPS
jgi:hypothetical protein